MVDSPYDLKTFVVRSSGEALYRRGTWLELEVQSKENVLMSCEITTRIARNLVAPMLTALIIAGALFTAQVTPIYMGTNFDDKDKTKPSQIVAVSSLVAGLAASFGIRKGP